MADTALDVIARQSWIGQMADPLSTAVHDAYGAAGHVSPAIWSG